MEFIGVISTVLWQQCCWNCKKKYNVSKERENWISVMRLPKFLSCPSFTHEWIVATKLSKMGGKKKKDATSITFSQQIIGG